MEEIRLIEPTMEYADDIMMFRKEMIEAHDEDPGSQQHSSNSELFQNVPER